MKREGHILKEMDRKTTGLTYYKCRDCGCILVQDIFGVIHHSAASPYHLSTIMKGEFRFPLSTAYIPSCLECRMDEALE